MESPIAPSHPWLRSTHLQTLNLSGTPIQHAGFLLLVLMGVGNSLSVDALGFLLDNIPSTLQTLGLRSVRSFKDRDPLTQFIQIPLYLDKILHSIATSSLVNVNLAGTRRSDRIASG